MTFTSNIFLIGLLPWFIGLTYLTRKKNFSKRLLLFLANSLFYIWGGIGTYVLVCVFTVTVWALGSILEKKRKKTFFVIAVLLTTMPLVFIKYTGFIIKNVNALFGCVYEIPNILIPIGISFFTFEEVSMLCDIYQGKIDTTLSVINVYLYLTFFPTVTSGPIVRFTDFEDGLNHLIVSREYLSSIERVGWGLCKKVLIADKIAIIADYYFDGVAVGRVYSCLGLWIGLIAYTLQLYFDFSGYSDMAIGIGNMLGFHIGENFNEPYQSSSISEFWKRWHISLSQWFRDYVYIPLGGNRCSVPRHIFNMLVVWLLTGIWHGADWTYVIWGVGYFILLVAEKYIPFMKNIGQKWIGHIYALFFINLLWLPFRAENTRVASAYFCGLFGINTVGVIESRAISFIPYLLVAIVLCFPWNKVLDRFREKTGFLVVRSMVMLVVMFMALCAVVSASYSPYIYGNF